MYEPPTKLTFVHMPRTGGITASQHLIRCGLLDRKKCQTPIWRRTEEERGRDVIGCIRDPLKWYPSVYMMSQVREPFADWLLDFMRKPHEHKTCCWGKLDAPPCPQLVGAYTYYHVLYYCQDPESALQSIEDWFWFRKTLAATEEDYLVRLPVTRWLRTEELDADLFSLTGKRPENRHNVLASSERREWYDEQQRRAVLNAEQFYYQVICKEQVDG